ncbi:MAG TPA: serine hydrolase domain-containing protein [Caulobacteraceae bacterium]|nr:serine hydrolase domain-containing protein [Caulobacteraceae bacterium]
MTSKFDAVMHGLIDPGGPGAAVGVRHGGQAPYVAGFGLADIEWGLPITPDTVFRLGSVTKQFTAAAIMLLVEDGKLGLDDDVRSVLADYPSQDHRITIRQLLTHTSGVANFNSRPDFPERTDLTLAEVIGLFKELPPDFAPGERYVYSNSGYVLLGAVIEALSGMAYRTFLLERFFRPLGMRQTRYLYDEPIVPKRARGYSAGPKGIQNARTMSMTLPHAAGALGSTVVDLLTWSQALRSGQAVSAESYAAMTAPARLNDGSLSEYGFGLIGLTFRERTAITHLGGINGFATMLTHFAEDDLTVVVLSNLDSLPVERASLALARRALDLPDAPARPRLSIAAADLERCAGLYRVDASPWPTAIAAADGELTAQFPTPNSRYEPFAPAAFQCVDDAELTLRFEQPGEAGYERMTIEGPMRSRWRTAIAARVAAPEG